MRCVRCSLVMHNGSLKLCPKVEEQAKGEVVWHEDWLCLRRCCCKLYAVQCSDGGRDNDTGSNDME